MTDQIHDHVRNICRPLTLSMNSGMGFRVRSLRFHQSRRVRRNPLDEGISDTLVSRETIAASNPSVRIATIDALVSTDTIAQ